MTTERIEFSPEVLDRATATEPWVRMHAVGPAGSSWDVPSSTDQDRLYRVTTDGRPGSGQVSWIMCTCAHGRKAGRGTSHCHHAAAVLMRLRAEARAADASGGGWLEEGPGAPGVGGAEVLLTGGTRDGLAGLVVAAGVREAAAAAAAVAAAGVRASSPRVEELFSAGVLEVDRWWAEVARPDLMARVHRIVLEHLLSRGEETGS